MSILSPWSCTSQSWLQGAICDGGLSSSFFRLPWLQAKSWLSVVLDTRRYLSLVVIRDEAILKFIDSRFPTISLNLFCVPCHTLSGVDTTNKYTHLQSRPRFQVASCVSLWASVEMLCFQTFPVNWKTYFSRLSNVALFVSHSNFPAPQKLAYWGNVQLVRL